MDIKLSSKFTNSNYSDVYNFYSLLKRIMSIIIFIFSLSIHSQDFITRGSIQFNDKIYKYSHISFGSSSHTKYLKFMTCSDNNLKEVQHAIIDCVKRSKLEYTEFYIIDLPYGAVKNLQDQDILFALINEIDKYRMLLNLSTVLIKQKYCFKDDKFSYFLDEPRLPFNDYKLNIKTKEVCLFLKN